MHDKRKMLNLFNLKLKCLTFMCSWAVTSSEKMTVKLGNFERKIPCITLVCASIFLNVVPARLSNNVHCLTYLGFFS